MNQIEGDVEDLFAALVADANEAQEENESSPDIVAATEKQEKADEVKAKIAAEKQEKAREAKAKIAAEKEAKAAKIAAEKEAKAREGKAKKPSEGKEKEAKKKPTKAPEGKAKEETAAADEEQDVVKKIEIDGKKYLKSKKSGIVYDYKEYINNSNQLVVGKWNNNTNKIDFTKSDEEIEEEYDEEDEDE